MEPDPIVIFLVHSHRCLAEGWVAELDCSMSPFSIFDLHKKMEFQKVLIADMIQVRGDYFQRETARRAQHRAQHSEAQHDSTAVQQDIDSPY